MFEEFDRILRTMKTLEGLPRGGSLKDFALSADDLWLKATELRLGIPVCKIAPYYKIPYIIGGSQKVTLGRINNGQKKNDVVMKKLCDHYGFEWEKLRHEIKDKEKQH